VAFQAGIYDTVGEDLVNHCVNDIFVQGARPLFFLDYIGISKVVPSRIESIIEGMVRGCVANDLALVGGEMAEMPDIYKEDDFDLVGTIIGCVERDKIINGSAIKSNDVIIGYRSSGLHTNGYTLARKVLFEKMGLKVNSYLDELGCSVGEALLKVHRSYYGILKNYAVPEVVHGMAHITGGGIPGNLSRVIPADCVAEIFCDKWEVPPIFQLIQSGGGIANEEMYRAFNMGVGYIVVTDESSAGKLLALDDGAALIGRIRERKGENYSVEMNY
jgi:phosphoribosylformylglycinamidine cyclo-ligase